MNIVIIDSGVGAEEIVKTLLMKDLSNNYTLLLDKSFFPYGVKTKKELNERMDYLLNSIDSNTELVIVGCNTLSVMVEKFNTNKLVIDMVSITNKYLYKNKFKRILLLATTNTIANNPFNTTFCIDATLLINAIQIGEYKDELNNIFNLIDEEYDAIILGCTHLIKVKNEFRNKYDSVIISQDELIKLPKSTVKIKEV